MREELQIKAINNEQILQGLSGGNQQKVLMGRWLLTEPEIFIMDEPTRGIDVGAKALIHKTISQMAKAGAAILMVSSEMPEIIGMSDRIMVVAQGRVAGFLTRKEVTQEKILQYATGEVKKEVEKQEDKI